MTTYKVDRHAILGLHRDLAAVVFLNDVSDRSHMGGPGRPSEAHALECVAEDKGIGGIGGRLLSQGVNFAEM